MQIAIAPYFHRYDLPWEPTDETRFKRLVRVLVIIVLVLGLIIPLLPRTEPAKRSVQDLPERVVQLIVEKPLLPPPPPPPPPPPKPQEVTEPKPAPVKPNVKPTEVKERVKQVGLLAMQDQLAELRQTLDPKDLARTDLNTVAEDVRSERNLITSKVGAASSGINTANLSRGYGGGAGAIGTHTTATVAAPASVSGKGQGIKRTGTSGKAARSREEIETIFDRNKGALYALYTRAQRDNPEIQGKLVLEITISPAGEVTMARVVSSELKDPELERKIIARVKLFRFEARDVEAITATKPIDFFPA